MVLEVLEKLRNKELDQTHIIMYKEHQWVEHRARAFTLLTADTYHGWFKAYEVLGFISEALVLQALA